MTQARRLHRRAWCAVRLTALLLLMPLTVLASQPRPLVVATYAYPQRDRAAAIAPLADYLGERFSRPAEVRVLPSPTALVAAMQAGEVDVAVPNLYGYLLATGSGSTLVALPVPDVPPAQAQRYRAVIVARVPMTMPQLAARANGLQLALVGPDSASGGVVPVAGLRAAGIEPDHFKQLRYAGSHAAALHALAAGEVEVAALAADVYDNSPRTGLHEVWRSQVIPPGPLLCRPSRTVDCAQIGDALLQAEERDARVMAGLRAGWPEFGDATAFVIAPVEVLKPMGEQLPAAGP